MALMVAFGLSLGSMYSILGWDLALNSRRRKKLLEEYAERGVEAPAMVMRQTVTHHRTNFIHTRTSWDLTYCYRLPESDMLYVKQLATCKLACETLEPITSRVFSVRVLPEEPRSGYPQSLIDRRKEDYGPVTTIPKLLAAIVFLAFGCAFCGAAGPYKFQLLSSFLVCIGLPIAPCIFHCWKKRVLHTVKCESLRPDCEMSMEHDAATPGAYAQFVGTTISSRGIPYARVATVNDFAPVPATGLSVNDANVDLQIDEAEIGGQPPPTDARTG